MTTTTATPERQPSEDLNPPLGTTSPTPRRPIFQTETTGDYWSDVREAFKVRPRPPIPPSSNAYPLLRVADALIGALVETIAT